MNTPPNLNEVCEFIVDCLHATAPTQEEGYPLIRTPNIGKGRLNLDGVYRVSEDTYERWTQRAVPQENDLILAREAPAGNVAIVRNGQQVCLGQRTVHLRPDPKQIEPAFLCYYLLAPPQQGALLAGETGATSKHVNMKDIRRLPLKGLPKLNVQQTIGRVLSVYDDLIENNRRRIQLLEESARLLYREWFVRLRFPGYEHVKIIDGVPEGWEKSTLGDSIVLNYGKALKADDRIEGFYPVYGSSGIVGTHKKPFARGPGIIVGRKGNVGSVFWSSKDFHPIDTVYYIATESSDYYLYNALQHIQFVSSDAAVPGLNRNYAYSRPYLLPSETIRSHFENIVTPIYGQIFKLDDYNEKLKQARNLMLPRFMNGEIEV